MDSMVKMSNSSNIHFTMDYYFKNYLHFTYIEDICLVA